MRELLFEIVPAKQSGRDGVARRCAKRPVGCCCRSTLGVTMNGSAERSGVRGTSTSTERTLTRGFGAAFGAGRGGNGPRLQ